MIHPKIPNAQTVIQLCKAKKIKHIIISPGSRSAPLTIGFTNDPYFKCYSIVDERCAAFFALGIAQQLQYPAALVCTSGSALLNYYPAIAEAFYSDIPLIVLSADRPKHLIGIGDGQTINQNDVFANHILYSTSLKLDIKDEKNIPENEDFPIFKNLEDRLERFLGFQKDIQTFNEEEINIAINQAVARKGPVHINIPFDEPLYERDTKLSVTPKVSDISIKPKPLDNYIIQECFDTWNASAKKMVLVGVNQPNEIGKKWLNELSKDDSVIVLTETTSNLHHDSFFPNIDQLVGPLSVDEQKALQPDVLVTFGGLIISKKIKSFLRKYQPKAHWHIDEKNALDTFFCLSNHIKTTPHQFLEGLLTRITHHVKSDYHTMWEQVKQQRLEKHELYLKQVPFSDFKVFEILLQAIPNHYILQVGNSSAIRYTQLFQLNRTLDVYCNRGTSGIDGSTSTAIGCAVAATKPTVLLTGDLSFLYDSNGLWNNYIPKNFRIIVVNNGGGGIFRILPGHKNTENFDLFFETKHNLTAKHLCKMYGLEYSSADTELQLKSKMKSFYMESEAPKLLEIFTPSIVNDEQLLNYFDFIS
ncbi:2-succinyl-5-enolpyruvyl-6-hydroxy-3-cyclohexene-1-carboxylate synthase [Mariniflexile ostreae]|uniref:2-succinyl-5-enolpyruvyl-6-hydroxy-3-cyclohexene-1-carboxylate synthase n=1 Tax=Mariniflexile ostreae TaxID=1520892 RepID=A0ABV5FAI8_9FLAO